MSLSEKQLKSISDLDECLKNLSPVELFDHEYRANVTLGNPGCIHILMPYDSVCAIFKPGYWDDILPNDVMRFYVFKKFPDIPVGKFLSDYAAEYVDGAHDVYRFQRMSTPEERPTRVKLIQ